MNWDHQHLEGKDQTRDIVATSQAYVPQMKEQGAQIIIALSHSGIGPAEAQDGMENASILLAGVEGINALMTCHSHLMFPSSSCDGFAGVDVADGHPPVMGGFWGSHMCLIDLMLERDGSDWKIVSHTSEARPISKRYEDRSITALVESDQKVLDAAQVEHDATLEYDRRAVGQTDAKLYSDFALVADDQTFQIVAQYIKKIVQDTKNDRFPILSAAARSRLADAKT